jgi:hypothetical protein
MSVTLLHGVEMRMLRRGGVLRGCLSLRAAVRGSQHASDTPMQPKSMAGINHSDTAAFGA